MVECGADALCFIFVPGGPRFVPTADFVRIGYSSRSFVSTVLVGASLMRANDIAAATRSLLGQ